MQLKDYAKRIDKTVMSKNWCFYFIAPEGGTIGEPENYKGNITTRFAVFKRGKSFSQQVSNWYVNYGNAERFFSNIIGRN